MEIHLSIVASIVLFVHIFGDFVISYGISNEVLIIYIYIYSFIGDKMM